jgi:glutathione S-transferase
MQPPAQPIKLYRFRLSGHCHRVELFLALLGLPCQLIDIDLPGKQQKSPQFLALNPFGQVPVIDDNGAVLADSNAILVYLALRYGEEGWLPRDALGAAAVQRWLSVAAGPLAFGPAAARVARLYKRPDNTEARDRAHALLAVMEQELSTREFLVGPRATLADIANYTYIAHAPEGGVMLDTYPQVRTWLKRIEALPGYIAMQPMPA